MSMPQEWRASFPVVDLSFQLRIRVDSELLLEQETFYQDQRRISLVAFGAFADGIVSQEQRFDSGPIHDGIDLLHFLWTDYVPEKKKASYRPRRSWFPFS